LVKTNSCQHQPTYLAKTFETSTKTIYISYHVFDYNSRFMMFFHHFVRITKGTDERSFSKLWLIKTFHWSTMT